MRQLYIDESGKNTLTNINPEYPHFAIGGVLVHNKHTDFIRSRGDQIKFKYWGSTDVVFHGNDIRLLTDDYRIFRDITTLNDNLSLKEEFHRDFKEYLAKAPFQFIWVGINKLKWIEENPPIKHAIKNGWSKPILSFEKKLMRLLMNEVFKTYICYLVQKKDSGQIIVEASDKVQDADILASYNHLMSTGISELNLDHKEIRERLTCISFVTKRNRDSETQIADIGSYFLNINARILDNTGYRNITDFDNSVATIFKEKSFTPHCCNVAMLESIRLL